MKIRITDIIFVQVSFHWHSTVIKPTEKNFNSKFFEFELYGLLSGYPEFHWQLLGYSASSANRYPVQP